MAPTVGRIRRLWWLLPLMAGCATMPAQIESRAPPEAARGIVIVLGGAGTYQNAQWAVATAVDEQHLPLYVRSFEWTHGLGRGLADQVDYAHARCRGRQLADEVCLWTRTHPGVPVSLVAFSAGSGVALAAAEGLPPDTLEHIVLLAPAVSAGYDLRRALLSARQGIDAFTSERDWLWLGVGTTLAGTADGTRQAPAGRVGFCPPLLCPHDAALAARLRQHPWDPSVAWTDNRGGHTGTLQPAYLKAYVLPLLTPG
jgi:hypothetical protein